MRKETKKTLLLAQKSFKVVMEHIKTAFECYCPPFQREVIQLIIKSQEPQGDISGDRVYVIGKIKKIFDNNVSLRNKLLSVYLNNVLPPLEAKYNKEVAIQDATDELLNLTNGKSVQEIQSMIQLLKTNGFTKKYKKCG